MNREFSKKFKISVESGDKMEENCEYSKVIDETRHEYIKPHIFTEYGEIAESMGFRHVASAPFVRSSYNAENALTSKNSF